MRILSVNGNPLLNVTHNDAVNVLRGAGNEIEMVVSNGYDQEEVDKLRAEGKLPDKIIEILSNSEEAAAATAALRASTPSKELVESEKKSLDPKASMDRVMEVVKAAEQLVIPSSPKDARGELVRHSPNTQTPVPPKSPTGFDVKKTTIVMTGHSLISPGLGGPKKFIESTEPKEKGDDWDQSYPSTATYVNLNDLESPHGTQRVDSGHPQNSYRHNNDNIPTGGKVNGTTSESENHSYGASRPPLPPNPPNLNPRHKLPPSDLSFKEKVDPNPALVSPPPVPTPRTSLSSINRTSPVPPEEVKKNTSF